MYEDDDYRNADNVRVQARGPGNANNRMAAVHPAGQGAGPYGYPGYPQPYPHPGYPQPYPHPGLHPAYGYGHHPQQSSEFNGRALGRILRVVTPLLVAVLPVPAAPTPIAATGDTPTDLKASLTNEANAIAYQTAIAASLKRDELIFALGEGIGLLAEKGLT